jgi:hypothetical protein
VVAVRYRIVIYAVIQLAIFACGVHLLRIRELGLYLFLVSVGAPASFVVEPLVARLMPENGWSLGSYAPRLVVQHCQRGN